MTWPGGATHALSITVDVAGVYGLPDGGAGSASQLTARQSRASAANR